MYQVSVLCRYGVFRRHVCHLTEVSSHKERHGPSFPFVHSTDNDAGKTEFGQAQIFGQKRGKIAQRLPDFVWPLTA